MASPSSVSDPGAYATPIGSDAAPHSFTVGRFISGAFTTWARNAGWVIPLGLLTYAPTAVAMYLAYSTMPVRRAAPPNLAFFGTSFVLGLVLLLLLKPVELLTISRAGVRRLHAEPIDLGDVLSAAGRSYFPALGLILLVGLAYVGTVCTVIVPLMLLTAWAASIPALVTERLGPSAALKRSWELSRGLRWQVFAGFLVLVLAAVSVACAVQGVLTVVVVATVTRAGAAGAEGFGRNMGVVQAVNMLVQGLESSLLTTACAVAYHQLRVATEGPGASHLARVFE